MEKFRKYIIVSILAIGLIIPIFFGIYVEYLFILEVNIFILLYLIFGLSSLFLIGKLIEVYGYDEKSIIAMKKHEFIDVLIN